MFETIRETLQRLGHGYYSPKYVMGDAHGAIDKAATAVFPDADRLTCWFHVLHAIKGQISSKVRNPSLESARILSEISQLQLSPTTEIFNAAATALMEFWRSDQRNQANMAKYFEDYWLGSHKYW